MRHRRAGKKLGRDSAHRKALYSNLAGALIEHGRIKTTQAKAKAVKPFAEQMITLGKRGDLHARRLALAELRSQDVVHQLFAEVAPRFAERPGGYTRIVKLGPRLGDAAEMVYLELVDYEPAGSSRGNRRVVAQRADAPARSDLAGDLRPSLSLGNRGRRCRRPDRHRRVARIAEVVAPPPGRHRRRGADRQDSGGQLADAGPRRRGDLGGPIGSPARFR